MPQKEIGKYCPGKNSGPKLSKPKKKLVLHLNLLSSLSTPFVDFPSFTYFTYPGL